MQIDQHLLGLGAILVGSVLCILAIAPFFTHALTFFIGIGCINYGLRLRRMPSLYYCMMYYSDVVLSLLRKNKKR